MLPVWIAPNATPEKCLQPLTCHQTVGDILPTAFWSNTGPPKATSRGTSCSQLDGQGPRPMADNLLGTLRQPSTATAPTG